MPNVEEELARIEKEMLQDMEERYRILGEGIAKLEYKLSRPVAPIRIDFAAIKKQVKKDKAFLAKCEKNRPQRNKEVKDELET